jgi:hypothetical protein
MRTVTAVLLALATAPLAAQKLPLPDQSDRLLQLIDLHKQWPGPAEEDDTENAKPHVDRRLATFLRNLAQPPLQDEDDLQVLGGRWLCVLGSMQQAASIEQVLVAARQIQGEQLFLDVKFLTMTADVYAKHLRPLLAPIHDQTALRGVVESKVADELLAKIRDAKAEIMQAPKVVAEPLKRAMIRIGKDIQYVKDFTLKEKDGGMVAEPVHDTLSEGTGIEILASRTDNGHLGLWCSMHELAVEQPLAELSTTPPGCSQPITIDVPHTTSIQLEQLFRFPAEQIVILAAPRPDGTWLATIIQVHIIRPAGEPQFPGRRR